MIEARIFLVYKVFLSAFKVFNLKTEFTATFIGGARYFGVARDFVSFSYLDDLYLGV